MTSSKIFLYFCLSFIGGIFLNSFLLTSLTCKKEFFLFFGLILGIILISVFWKYKKAVVFGFCILFLVLGIWRHQSAEFKILNNELRRFNDTGEKNILSGIIVKEPEIKEKSQKLIIRPLGKEFSKEKGKILIIAKRYPEYQYGDKIEVAGYLRSPKNFGDFDYSGYLAKDGIYSTINWPKIEIVEKNFGNPLMKILISFKNKFKEGVEEFISPPQQGILEALVFGDETNISKEWKDKLNFTGVRHIAAVSGMNITIICFLVFNFFLQFKFWRSQAFYFSVIFIFFYILMVGAPASAVRAGIMGILFLAGQHFGRVSSGSRPVFFACGLMLFQNPLLLKYDIGFQLSFLAILGIVYLQSSFSDFLKKIPDFKFFPLKTTLCATLAAQVFTLPVLVYNFEYIPLISPLTNILIVPFLAFFTILFFIFGLTAIFLQPLAFALSLISWFCLTYIILIIDYFSKLPFASLTLKNIHWIFLAIFYLILGFITWRLQEKQKLKFLDY